MLGKVERHESKTSQSRTSSAPCRKSVVMSLHFTLKL